MWGDVRITDAICTSETYWFECLWENGARAYSASGRPEHMPKDAGVFATEVTNLLEGFAADVR